MVNEDILTGLKNAVDHGDSLEAAVSTAISSGYNPKEVQEAAQFVGQGTLPFLQTKPEEHLMMPNKKSFLGVTSTKPMPSSPVNSPTQEYSQIKREISPSQNTYSASIKNNEPTKTLSQEISQMSPKKTGYLKEIILGIILLMLLGVLGITFLLKDALLEFFSSL